MLLSSMSNKFIYWYLNFASCINSSTIKKILKTTTYIALFTIVFITSWAVPQEEASATANWECNDSFARAYFYKLDWDYTSTSFTIDQYVATETTTIQRETTTVDFSSTSNIVGNVKGINALAMSPTGVMYVTITSDGHGTHLFTISTAGVLTPLAHIADYTQVGDLDFYDGVNGYYGFSSGEYVVNANGNDQIYMAQAGFKHGYIYNVDTGGVTTFADPGMTTHINAADFSYIGDWDGYELATYNALANKVVLYDKDNNSISEVTPSNAQFNGVSATLASYTYKTPEGEIRFIIDDGLGNRFEVKRTGTNQYTVATKGTTFTSDNTDGASCGPNAYDPFAPSFKTSLGACASGYQQPTLLITNNRQTTQYFDVDYRIAGGSWTELLDGTQISPGGQFSTSGAPAVYQGQTVEYRMKYDTSNPSSGGTRYTVGDLLTGSGCGDYAAGTVDTAAGTCDGGSSTPSVTLTNTGTVNAYFDVQYKITSSGTWITFIDGELVVSGTPETISLPTTVANGQTVYFQYIVADANPTATTGFTSATNRTIDCKTYTGTITATTNGTCNNDYMSYTVTLSNTGNTSMYFSHAKRTSIGSSAFSWQDQWGRTINAGQTYTYTANVYHGVIPEFKMVYGTSNYIYYATDLHSSGNTEGTFTSRSYGGSLKSGDSWIRWTASNAVDCLWWGNGGESTNSSANYTRISQSTSQICDGSGNATLRLTVTNYNASNDSYGGYIDVEFSPDNVNWTEVVDGQALADGQSLTFSATETIASSSTGYFRYRIAETNPTDSTSNAAWAVFSREANCVADFTQSATFSTCSSVGRYSTLSVTNNEAQTLYFKAAPSLNSSSYYNQYSSSYVDWSNAITFSVAAGQTLTYDATNSPDMRKLYPDDTEGYMQWVVQGSYIENPDWTNTSAYPYKYTTYEFNDCNPSVTLSYEVTACSSAGQTSTLTLTNNESETVYFKVTPTKTANPYSYNTGSAFDSSDTTTFSIAAGQTLVYTAGAKTYTNEATAYMGWKIQKSYTENPSWNTTIYEEQFINNPSNGISWFHDCSLAGISPNRTEHQYETFPSNVVNSCVDNKQWMGWQLYNSNYNDASRTALWYAFEISLDDGANWTTNDLFYRTYSNYHYNADLAVGNSDVTGNLATDGYTAVQATNYINMQSSYNNSYIYLGTRALSGSVMKIRYKIAFAESELASTDWIVWGYYGKSTEQRTTNCDPVITTTDWGTATTTDSTDDTYSDLVTFGECQNTLEIGGFATATFTVTRPAGTQYYLYLAKTTDGGSNWTDVETNLAVGTSYTDSSTVNHAGTIQYKFKFSYTSGDFSNSKLYYSAVKTVNCPTVGASTASIALGTCVSGGATPSITIGNNGWARGYFHVQYSVDLGNTWEEAFYDPNNGNAVIYKSILPGAVETYTIQDTIPQGTTIVMKYRYAVTSPVTSGSFTNTSTLLLDCTSDVTSHSFSQLHSASSCYDNEQTIRLTYGGNTSDTNYLIYQIKVNDGAYSVERTLTLSATSGTSTVDLFGTYSDGDIVTIKYHIENTTGGTYATAVEATPITVDCGVSVGDSTDDPLYFQTDYVSCSLYGPDKFELKLRTRTSVSSNTYVHFQVEISHDGNTWKPFGQMQYSNEGNTQWYKNHDYGGLTGDNATYFGYVRPYYYSTSEYVASVILLDSSHGYQIRYRHYSSNTSTKYMENFTGNYSTITVAADSDCNSNDLQPVTLTTTQLTCLENKGQVEFKFEDTTVTHLEPYEKARLFYQYSTNGGVSWSTVATQTDELTNSITFNLPSVQTANGQSIKVKWGYIRYHDFYSTNGSYQIYDRGSYYYSYDEPPTEYAFIKGLTSTGLYYDRYDEGTNTSGSITENFNANFMNHVMVNTTDLAIDCDPDSEYSQTLTTCECDDAGATSTLSITNNDNYTSYYKVRYSLDGGNSWLSATDSLESAFDISVSAGSTNNTLSKFVDDGKSIIWQVKDTTNGGDFEGQEWETVNASATVDCGCEGGTVQVNVGVGTCGNGSSTPVVKLTPTSSDTTYFKVEYKRNIDTDWQTFKTAEVVSNNQPEEHNLDVTVVHSGSIQVRYKVSKVLSSLDSGDWSYTDTKVINCPFNAVTGEASYTACAADYRASSYKVTNTSSSTSAAKFNVQYQILDGSGTAVVPWKNSSIVNATIAPGVSLYTTDNIKVYEGQKIEWKYEAVDTSASFTGVWIEDTTLDYVNCVIDVTVTNAMGACDSGSQKATLSLKNNESLNTIYFQVFYTVDDGQNWTLKESNIAVAAGATDTSITHDVGHTKRIRWRYQTTNTSNNYTGAPDNYVDYSTTVACPILDGTGSAAFGNCTSSERRSVFTYTNSSSANQPAYFYIQYNLSGDSEDWITKVNGTAVVQGTSATTYVMVPNGQTIQWRYYPMSTATTPSSYITLSVSDEVNCSLDTVTSLNLDTCINNASLSRYVLTNNTSGTVYYQVEYFIQGSNSWVTVDTDLTLGAAGSNTQSAEFTQNVDTGKYIQWRYKAATSLAGLVSASFVDALQSATVNCATIDPSVEVSFGICYNNTKEVKFIIKNSTSATTSALFKVQVNVNDGGWVDKPDITLGTDGQFPHSQIIQTGQTIQWRYKVGKTVSDLPTDWTTDTLRTITCAANDITVELDDDCDANGYKTSKLNINNSSSGTLYYKAEYSTNGTDWTLSANQVLVGSGLSTFLQESVSEGETITWRYKISETGNDFDNLQWVPTDTSEIVNCTGVNIPTPYTSIGQCLSGSKSSKFHYGTLSSSAAPAYYHIQYRIDGGVWTDKITSSNGLVVAGANTSTSHSVTSGSSIEWRYKAAYSTAALANISFTPLAGGAIDVDCGTFISVVHQMGTCSNQTATSTLTLNNTGSTPLLVTVHSNINSGDWTTEVSTVEIIAGDQLVLTRSLINGQTISWKYKYAGTVVKLSSAAETTFGSIPALDCETEVLNQVSVNDTLKACVEGKSVSALTVTNNSSETVYVEAWYDSGNGWITKGTSPVINGTPLVLESPGAADNATVKWRYRLGLSTNITSEYTTRTALTVDCPQTHTLTQELQQCSSMTRDSKISINNTGTVTQYFKIEYSINDGGYQYLTTVSVAAGQVDTSVYKNLTSGQYVTWRYAVSTVENDFSNSSYLYKTRTESVNCTDANLVPTQNTTCTPSGTTSIKNSTFTISNTSSTTAQVEVAYTTDNLTWTSLGTQAISTSQPYSTNNVLTTNYIIYRYRVFNATAPNPWVQEIVMSPDECATIITTVSAYITNECISGSPVTKLTIINPSSTAAFVSYDISINGASFQTVDSTSVTGNFTSASVAVPENSTFQWRYKTSAETTYKTVNGTAKNCSQPSSLTGFTDIVCDSNDGTKAVLNIVNAGDQTINVMYDYKINNGSYQTGAVIPVNANDSAKSIQVPLNSGDQIIFRYKTTSDTQYKETPSRSETDCGSNPMNPMLGTSVAECFNNTSSTATVEVINLSDEVKSFYLERKIDNGPWSNYELVTVNPNSLIRRELSIPDGTTIQWRALDSSYTQFSQDSPYSISASNTLKCTVEEVILPPVKYIFEPLISTNRVCDFEDGGAEFGITVDNSRSNVAAGVLKKIWINTTLIAEETVNVPAGQSVDFSSIEVGENKFFTVALEVTNTENGKVQKMIKNKDADCIEDERLINDGLNPIDEVEVSEDIDNVMDGDGDDQEMEDNGESLLFLPGDDFVEFVYNEDADNPFVPQFTDESPPTPGIPFTGRNVGGFIISFGLLLMGLGAFILRRAY